jgi:peptide-methionine (S)-S-oxide reductase
VYLQCDGRARDGAGCAAHIGQIGGHLCWGLFLVYGGSLRPAAGCPGERAPTYRQVSSGQTSHYEALRVVYDPQKVSLGQLLEVFWRNIDPTQADGQFCDKGKQYRSAVFVSDPKELSLVEDSRAAAAAKLGTAVVTQVLPKADFWLAEEYHQDFYQKKPEHYMRYRLGCGRDRRLLELWGRAGH